MKTKLICLLIIQIFLFQSISPSAIDRTEINFNHKHQKITNANLNKTITDNFDIQLLNIANTLIKFSETSSSQSIKWKKIINAPNSPLIADQYYPGLYSGVAGIGLFFLNLYQYNRNETYLEIAQKSANYVLSQKKVENSSIYWQRSEYFLSDSYSSQKYGPAGIVEFLLALYKETNTSVYLKNAENTMNSLIIHYLNNTNSGKNWAYSYFGDIPLTGIMYGVTGIVTAFVDLYDLTKNATYLNEAELGINWIISLSNVESSDIGNLRSISYSPTQTYPFNFTGYSTGVSGIGDFFLKFYSKTKDQKYVTYADEIGKWLLKNEHNGAWYYGGVDYMTEGTNQDGYYTGLSSGSAGIGIFLMNLYQQTNDTIFKDAVQRIHSFLLKEMKIKESGIYFMVQSQGTQENITQTGLKHGVAGVGVFFDKYYRLFDFIDDLNVLNGIQNYLESQTTSDGLIPMQINSSSIFFDSSLFEGLAGIGLFYLDTILSTYEKISLRNTAFQSNFLLESYTIVDLPSDSSSLINLASIFFIILCLVIILRRFKLYKIK